MTSVATFAKKIDFAVHSLKDLPQEDPDELSVSVIPKRADPRDALIGVSNPKIIGTGSKRRVSQLKSLYCSKGEKLVFLGKFHIFKAVKRCLMT